MTPRRAVLTALAGMAASAAARAAEPDWPAAISIATASPGGTYHAYLNSCPHVGTPLDLWENEFLSEDGRVLICATHGAVFDPPTGRCIAGPCAGDALTALPLRLEGGSVIVACQS